jgi:ADP-heptose:LPS heptosyltransferase
MTKERSIVILKNDAVGDLTQSLPAINNIIKNNKTIKIIIYLSERSENFSFLINNNLHENIEFKKVNYNLNIYEKLKIFFFFFF